MEKVLIELQIFSQKINLAKIRISLGSSTLDTTDHLNWAVMVVKWSG